MDRNNDPLNRVGAIVYSGDSYRISEGAKDLQDYATLWGVDMEMADQIANQGCIAIRGCERYNKWA